MKGGPQQQQLQGRWWAEGSVVRRTEVAGTIAM